MASRDSSSVVPAAHPTQPRSGDLDQDADSATTGIALARQSRHAHIQRRRWRALSALALLGCLGLLALMRALAPVPHIDAVWRTEAGHVVELVSSPLPELRSLAGAHLTRIGTDNGLSIGVDDSLLQRSPRWTADDAQRLRLIEVQQGLASMLRQGPVTLHFDGGRDVRVSPTPRGLAGLGAFFWLMCAVALSLALVAAAVLVAHPHRRNLPYLVISLCQGANLLVIGIETLPGLGLPEGFAGFSLRARIGFDLFSAAGMVHLSTLQPLRLPGGRWIAAATWLLCAAFLAGVSLQTVAWTWWWTQALMLGCGILTIGLMSWSYRLEPHPFAVLMRRLATAATVTLLLLSMALAVAARHEGIALGDASFSSVSWYLFLSALILLLPVFLRTQPLMRELAMLACTSTVATSLNLLFVSTFMLGTFASLSLSVFFALVVYAGTRQWLLDPMSGQQVPGAERLFERLYRVLREVEDRPRDSAELLTRLLRDLFEPLEVTQRRSPCRALARARQRLGAAGAGAGDRCRTRSRDRRLHRAALCAAWQAHVLARGRTPHRPSGRPVAPRRGLRQGGGTRAQRRARAHRTGPSRRHRRAPADADVQGPDAGRWKTTSATR